MFKKEDLKKAKCTVLRTADLSMVDGEFEKQLRKELHLTQALMAAMLHVSIDTVESWEQGVNKEINGAARALLFLIADDHGLARRLMQIEGRGEKIRDEWSLFACCHDLNHKEIDYPGFAEILEVTGEYSEQIPFELMLKTGTNVWGERSRCDD